MATVATLASAKTTTGASPEVRFEYDGLKDPRNFAVQVVGSVTADAGAATVAIEVSNDRAVWMVVGTVTLTLSTEPIADGFAVFAPWPYMRSRITALNGTGASITATVAY